MVNYNKKSLLYCCVLYVLSNIFVIQAMEKIEYAIEKDWGYKKRENKNFCCCKDTDDKKYPYFVSTGAGDMISERRDITERYHEMFGKDCNIESWSAEDKRTLAYLLETIQKNEKLGVKEFRIEGRDKDFSQKMSLRVKNLPLEIKQHIRTKYGETMISNIYYQPSYYDTVMNNEDNKIECAFTTTGGISCLWYWLLRWCCPITPTIAIPPYTINNSDQWESFRIFTTYSCFSCWYVIIKKCLYETPEQKDKRHGFAAIPLLKEMKCTIVDAKEKQD